MQLAQVSEKLIHVMLHSTRACVRPLWCLGKKCYRQEPARPRVHHETNQQAKLLAQMAPHRAHAGDTNFLHCQTIWGFALEHTDLRDVGAHPTKLEEVMLGKL